MALAFALIDWFKNQPAKKTAGSPVKNEPRNPKGNVESLAKAREAKRMKAEQNHFLDFDDLADIGQQIEFKDGNTN